MSQEELSDLLTEYIMMSSYGLRQYTDEESIAYFSRMHPKTLSEMLNHCEHLEEYEFCTYIFTALKKKEVYTLTNVPYFSMMVIVD
ncbi:MAG: hypothetical protein H7Y86_04125 [Rhizobacter sp.]|nr:hypothetical protein [Ferruginibacter sp.]